jgi:hypothetical protein
LYVNSLGRPSNLRKMPERHTTDYCPLEVKRFLLTMNSSDVGMTFRYRNGESMISLMCLRELG